MTVIAPLDRASLERVIAPLGSSSSLPADAYRSPEVFAWELEHLFESSWVCVGRLADVATPGDRMATNVGHDGVLVVRGGDNRVRCFFNVCAHRGHEVVEPGSRGSGRVLKCPYHGWVYGSDGALRATPNFDGTVEPGTTLARVRSETWHGWVFANTSGSAVAFDDYVGNLGARVAPYEPERLVLGEERRYEVAANWKLLVENYHECYHCPQIHPELCRVTPPDSGEQFERQGEWVGGTLDLREGVQTMALDGVSRGVTLRGVSGALLRTVAYLELFPNLLLSLHPDYVMTHRIEPLAPGRSRVECRWYFPPEAFEQPGFDPSYATDLWHLTNEQDWHACESVQRALGGRGYRQGPISPKEESLYHFITKVASRYLGS